MVSNFYTSQYDDPLDLKPDMIKYPLTHGAIT